MHERVRLSSVSWARAGRETWAGAGTRVLGHHAGASFLGLFPSSATMARARQVMAGGRTTWLNGPFVVAHVFDPDDLPDSCSKSPRFFLSCPAPSEPSGLSACPRALRRGCRRLPLRHPGPRPDTCTALATAPPPLHSGRRPTVSSADAAARPGRSSGVRLWPTCGARGPRRLCGSSWPVVAHVRTDAFAASSRASARWP